MSYSTIICCITLVLQASSLHARVPYYLEIPANNAINKLPSLAKVHQEAEQAASAGCYQEAYEILKADLTATENNEIFTAHYSTEPSLPPGLYGIFSLILLLFLRSRQYEMMFSGNSDPILSSNAAACALSTDPDPETKAPKRDSGLSLGSHFLCQTRMVILEHIDEESFGIAELSKMLCISRSQLHRKIKAETSYSPSVFMRKIRLEEAAKLLDVKAGNISEVAFMVGMPNLAHFSRSFKAEFGYPPSRLLSKEVNSRRGSE